MPEGCKVFIYIVAYVTIDVRHPFSSVIERLRDAGFEVLDYDEQTRRVVVRGPRRMAGQLYSYLQAYSASASIEVKMSTKARLKPRTAGLHIARAGQRLLFLYHCKGGGLVWGEARGRRVLAKYCRGGLYRDPASFPQGMCMHTFRGSLEELVRSAEECFSELMSVLCPGPS